MIARFDITPAQIDRTVAVFYAAIRRHEVLGPVFARHIEDWPGHEATISRFWQRAILSRPVYDGNPMRVHLGATGIEPEHFAIWLALFDETLRRTLPPDPAATWSALAHRIGRGLRMGIEDRRPQASAAKPAPPILR